MDEEGLLKRTHSKSLEKLDKAGLNLKRRSSPWPEVGFVYILNKTYS